MQILGAKHMLELRGPKLVYEFWRNQEDCLDLLKRPSAKNIFNIIKDDIKISSGCVGGVLQNIDLSIWINTNEFQIYPITDTKIINLTEINIVGDANPCETLWFVFDSNEFKLLDHYFCDIYDILLSKILNDNWKDYVESVVKFGCDNKVVKDSLDKENNTTYDRYIMNTNITIDLGGSCAYDR